MRGESIASWLREEHEKLAKLSAALQEKSAFVPRIVRQDWLDALCGTFDHFRAHLMQHMALEEEGGYMSPIVEQRPALSREVDRLAHEHAEIGRLMAGLKGELSKLAPEDRLLIRDCSSRIQALLLYVDHHERAENLLVTSALGEDIGTTD